MGADGGELTLFEGCLEGGAYPTIALADARSIMGLLFLSVFDTTGMVIAWWGVIPESWLLVLSASRAPGIAAGAVYRLCGRPENWL